MGFISSGTTMFDNGALVASAGSQVLLSTATASASASLSFNSTYINSDYLVYKFELINIHPSVDNRIFSFNLSIDNGSNYNVTKTSTFFKANHGENGSGDTLAYDVDYDLAQSTAAQAIAEGVGNDDDQATSGTLILFNPSSTTYVKHFISNINTNRHTNASMNTFVGGYGNTTSAVDAIIFQMNSGNIDAGQIKLYGIKN